MGAVLGVDVAVPVVAGVRHRADEPGDARPELRLQHVQGGPALRYAELTDNGSELDVSGRAALDARLQLRPGVTLTQNATAFLDSQSNTFTSATGLETQLIGALTARVSYNIQHESDPAIGRVATDTQSRVTFVYAF